jgi:hypothetical protein
MFGAINKLTIVNGMLNKCDAQFFDNILLTRPLKSFALKKCQVSDACLAMIFLALKLPACQV